jgi:hypothetical protein
LTADSPAERERDGADDVRGVLADERSVRFFGVKRLWPSDTP